MFRPRYFAGFAALLLVVAADAHAWGRTAHRIVGQMAYAMLDDKARAAVVKLMGPDSAQAFGKACYWPDTIRDLPQWEWSAPLHYVNLPRSETVYDRGRDCPDSLCATEGIIRFADELGRPETGATQRWQALAWLCHLVADLHQPLHAGYRDDRGGNEIEVIFEGELVKLHAFWDSALIRSKLRDRRYSPRPEADCTNPCPAGYWSPVEVAVWTGESHALLADAIYPSAKAVDGVFAERGWKLVQRQWQKAARRLACLLNSVLGEGELRIRK